MITEHRGRPLPEELIREVRRLRREGISIRGIGRQMHLAHATVQKYASHLPVKHPKGVELSNGKIAEHVGVSSMTVAKYRGELKSTYKSF